MIAEAQCSVSCEATSSHREFVVNSIDLVAIAEFWLELHGELLKALLMVVHTLLRSLKRNLI